MRHSRPLPLLRRATLAAKRLRIFIQAALVSGARAFSGRATESDDASFETKVTQ